MKQTITKILQEYEIIDFALLFGSYASEKQGFLSDIDIAIFTKNDIDIFMLGEITASLQGECGKKIDLVVLNGLYKTNAKLAFNIINNHQILFCENEKKYLDFKTKTLQYYFDLSYMYEMFDRELEKRIKNGTFGKTKAS